MSLLLRSDHEIRSSWDQIIRVHIMFRNKIIYIYILLILCYLGMIQLVEPLTRPVSSKYTLNIFWTVLFKWHASTTGCTAVGRINGGKLILSQITKLFVQLSYNNYYIITIIRQLSFLLVFVFCLVLRIRQNTSDSISIYLYLYLYIYI